MESRELAKWTAHWQHLEGVGGVEARSWRVFLNNNLAPQFSGGSACLQARSQPHHPRPRGAFIFKAFWETVN